MNAKRYLLLIFSGVLVVALAGASVPGLAGELHLQEGEAEGTPVGSAFTYQGRLTQRGWPYDGTCDLRFGLWDAPEGGTRLADPLEVAGVGVDQGRFAVTLDFGLQVFNGEQRWLEIEVSCPSGAEYSLLGRQEITAAPYALYAQQAPWAGLLGVPAATGDLTGTYPNMTVVGLQNRPLASTEPSSGQVLKWDGTAVQWAPSADQDTTYSAGDGLTLSDSTLSADTTYLQRRVSSSCTGGSSIRQINEDGTVVCEAVSSNSVSFVPQDNAVSTLDSAGNVGMFTSITVGADGLGLVSYYDGTNSDLKVAHCDNLQCSTATTYTLDSEGSVGIYTSITVGADGLGLVSYQDGTNGALKVAHCDNLQCSTAATYTLDSSGDAIEYTSITVGADGLGLVSYLLGLDDGIGGTNYSLKVAHCEDVECSSATTYTLDSAGKNSDYTSVTLGADGLGLVSYQDGTNYDLKVAHCDDIDCSTATTYTLDSAGNVGFYNSITVGADGLGLVSYKGSGLKVAHCDNLQCSSATTYTLDSDVNAGSYTSITVGTDGLGLVSYRDTTSFDLKVAHCEDVECSTATTYRLDSAGDVGQYTSITVGADGLGLVSYRDGSPNNDLKVAHRASPFCVPYWRRR